jgi:hypothetical protein
MDRKLSIERIYNLGEYKSIHLGDEINIPEKYAMKEDICANIRYLQLVDVELAYTKYLQLAKQTQAMNLDEAAKSLEETRLSTLETLKKLFNGDLPE